MPKMIIRALVPLALAAVLGGIFGCGERNLSPQARELRARFRADTLFGPTPEDEQEYLRARRDSLIRAAGAGGPDSVLSALLDLAWLHNQEIKDAGKARAAGAYAAQWLALRPPEDSLTARMRLMCEQAYVYYADDRSRRDSALRLIRRAGELKARRGGARPWDGYYYYHLAYLRDLMDDFDGVEAQFDSAAALFDRPETRPQYYRTLASKAHLMRTEKPAQATRIYLRLLAYLETLPGSNKTRINAKIANLYMSNGNLAAAEKYLGNAITYARENNHSDAIGYVFKSLSELLLKRAARGPRTNAAMLDSALSLHDSALYYRRKVPGSDDALLMYMGTRAEIYLRQGRLKKAAALADSIMPELKRRTMYRSYVKVALVSAIAARRSGRYEKALEILREVKDMEYVSKEFRVAARREIVRDLLSLGREEEAAAAFLEYVAARDRYENEASRKLEREMTVKYESDKKDAELARQRTDLARKNRQLWLAAFVGLVILGLLGLAGWFYKRQRAASRELSAANADLTQANEEISTSREELRATLEELSNKQEKLETAYEKISESIVYASRIQQAMLPTSEALSRLPPHFVWYKPRDVVSGDIYWAWAPADADVAYFAVIDCTGHGVPGAFMSVLARAYLDQTVAKAEDVSPERLLDQLAASVRAALQQVRDDSSVLDGMDMTLCRLNLRTLDLSFASAGRPLYVCRGGEVDVWRGDRFPVGGARHQEERFRLRETRLRPGDRLVLFTDGVTDQFGGPDKRKYTQKRLKAFLAGQQGRSLLETQVAFFAEFDAWQRGAAQLDDQTLLVVAIPK